MLCPFHIQIDTEQLLAHLVEAEMIKRTVSFITVIFSFFFIPESVHADLLCF
jgi:putative effector of murein hydrolase LrgA (UPF0299 family)